MTPARRARNRSRASTMTRFIPRFCLERHPQELRLLLAHQPVVDVDAGQPVADRAMDERRRDGRVDAARQRADDQAVRAGLARVGVDALADLGDRRVDEVGRRPGRRWARDADDEVAQHVRPRGVWTTSGWNWMPYRLPLGVGEPGERRRVGLGRGAEALGEPGDRVAVAHPDRLVAVEAREQAVVAR